MPDFLDDAPSSQPDERQSLVPEVSDELIAYMREVFPGNIPPANNGLLAPDQFHALQGVERVLRLLEEMNAASHPIS